MKKVILILFLFCTLQLWATDRYVSTSGTDSGNALTQGTAWRTLQYANDHASAGDVIALKKGDVWNVSAQYGLQITHGGTIGNDITWDGSLWGSGSNAKILATGDMLWYYNMVHIAGVSYLKFKNIVVDGANYDWYGIVVGGGNGDGGNNQLNETNIVIDGCTILNIGNSTNYSNAIMIRPWNTNMNNISVINCTINGCNNQGIALYPGRSNVGAPTPPRANINCYLAYNTITNCGRLNNGIGSGILVNEDQQNCIVEYNTITQGTSGHAIGIAVASNEPILGHFPVNCIIRYNDIRTSDRPTFYIQNGQAMTGTFHNNLLINTYTGNSIDIGGVILDAGDITVWTGAHFYWYNNTIITSGGVGFRDASNATGVHTLKNNIIINNGTHGAGTDWCTYTTNSNSIVHDHNSYYKNTSTTNRIYNQGTILLANMLTYEPTCITSNPLFISTTDFHLQTNSPCIDVGTNVALTYYGIAPDLGAFEYGTQGNTANDPRKYKNTNNKGNRVVNNGKFVKN